MVLKTPYKSSGWCAWCGWCDYFLKKSQKKPAPSTPFTKHWILKDFFCQALYQALPHTPSIFYAFNRRRRYYNYNYIIKILKSFNLFTYSIIGIIASP